MILGLMISMERKLPKNAKIPHNNALFARIKLITFVIFLFFY